MNGKVALVFPGQGSQYKGMGKDFFEEGKEIYEMSKEVLDFDIKRVIFDGDTEELRRTKYTQVCVFFTSLLCYNSFKKMYDGRVDYLAGHSLGEYTALCVSDVFSILDGFKIVKRRGEIMEEAGRKFPGGMCAVLGLELEEVKSICEKLGLEIANINCPGQVVVSGEMKGIESLKKMRLKVIPLNVSGAFHSKLMEEAKKLLQEELMKIAFKQPKIPIATNVDAEITTSPDALKNKLIRQIREGVQWNGIIKNLISKGVNTFVEIGPGSVLSKLIYRTDKNLKILNVEDRKSLEETMKKLL